MDRFLRLLTTGGLIGFVLIYVGHIEFIQRYLLAGILVLLGATVMATIKTQGQGWKVVTALSGALAGGSATFLYIAPRFPW